MSLLKNTAQPEKRDIMTKIGDDDKNVPWAEIGKYGPR